MEIWGRATSWGTGRKPAERRAQAARVVTTEHTRRAESGRRVGGRRRWGGHGRRRWDGRRQDRQSDSGGAIIFGRLPALQPRVGPDRGQRACRRHVEPLGH